MRLLLDENISPALPAEFLRVGVDALPIRNRGMLQATDPQVWRLAQLEERAVVTINRRDFLKLAAQSERHHGLVVIPSGGTRGEQFAYISGAIDWASAANSIGPNFVNLFVEVDESGNALGQFLHAAPIGAQATVVPLRGA